MGLSLTGVEPFNVRDDLEPGSYVGEAVQVKRGKSNNQKNPQVQVDWRVQGGTYRGAEKRDWVTFTTAALGQVVQVLDAAGIAIPQAEFDSFDAMADWFADNIGGKRVEFVVRTEEYKGEARPKIIGYRRPGESHDTNGDSSGFASGPSTKSDDAPPF